jgi:N-acetylated-alpha-linked acidic dipeptidase
LPSLRPLVFLLPLALLAVYAQQPATPRPSRENTAAASGTDTAPARVFGFRDFTQQAAWDSEFLAVPDPQLAQQHLKVLTAAPHWASSPEDYATALYVAGRFNAAGLQTEIVPYSVLIDKPVSSLIEAFDPTGRKILAGPTPAHVVADTGSAVDTAQNDARVMPPFSAWSASGDVTAPVVYANYGRLTDFQQLAELGISVKDKIVLVRNGGNYRGVKVYIAQRRGAKGVLIYSDPSDDGSHTGHPYPDGPFRPDSAAQLGSVQFMPIYSGDPTTPGIASVPELPAADRIPVDKLQNDLPGIPVAPLSAADAAPILHALGGTAAPRDWQGGLPFPYHLGGGGDSAPVSVHMRLTQDAELRTIWDVIGKIPGSVDPSQWVVAGNHRDAWVYGAGDPGSGTAAMLEAVHGLGVLLEQGWKPRRTIIVASWDAEEEGLIGSTEWVEQSEVAQNEVAQNEAAQPPGELRHAVAYFNMDVGVSGPVFTAAAVPSLRQFMQEIAKEVPSPAGGTVYQQWRKGDDRNRRKPSASASAANDDVPHIGILGSGSDYTPFLQHAGVPATDIGSDGPFGVYHTVYDNYDWFVRFADPTFAYTQQQARIFGLEMLHMADADVLPFDYQAYAEDIRGYVNQARSRAVAKGLNLDFTAALAAARSFETAAQVIHQRQLAPPPNVTDLNRALSLVEHALLIPAGLPRRPWYRHSIYAPGEFTGYEAVVIPGVNEAINASDAPRAQAQLDLLAQALTRAAAALTPPAP